MHPVDYLFQEIYRNDWGIPDNRSDALRAPARSHRSTPTWRWVRSTRRAGS